MKRQKCKKGSLDLPGGHFQKRKKRKKWIAGSILLVSFLLSGILFSTIPGKDTEEIQRIPPGLPEVEAKNWKEKEVDEEQLFINLNTALTVHLGENEANIALMNPPYSAYRFRIKIVLKNEKEDLLYSSDFIYPGTYLPMITFQKELQPGGYEAMVHYTFYGETSDAVIGEHMVPIAIEVNE